MSLSALVNGGAECGPANPLQGLSKRFDQVGHGAQHDQFRSNRAGSSKELFRTQPAQQSAQIAQEAAAFFQGTSTQQLPAQPFDLSALNSALASSARQNASVHPSLVEARQHMAGPGWAADFSAVLQPSAPRSLIQHARNAPTAVASASSWAADFSVQSPTAHAVGPQAYPSQIGLQPMHQPMPLMRTMNAPIQYLPPSQGVMPSMQTTPVPIQQDWASHFNQVETQNQSSETATSAETKPELVADDLASTAGLLVDSLRHETSSKFKNSAFMGLMRQLRDREMVVDGNDMVAASTARNQATDWASGFETSDLKGKGREVPMVGHSTFDDMSSFVDATGRLHTRRKSVHFQDSEHPRAIPTATAEDFKEWEDELEQEQKPRSWETHRVGIIAAQTAEWDQLQKSWDEYEATAIGFKPVLSTYQFQPNNPYLLGESSYTNHHAHHSMRSMYESVLEKEAAVQRDQFSAQAWFELGVKQQENERELKAIEALKRAVELDPTLLSAWLALAISYTNENLRSQAHDSIRQWILQNEKYMIASAKYLLGSTPEAQAGGHDILVDCLLDMARMNPEGAIDADTQIALAVLLNSTEEYEKAQDCFRAALEVRPDDWLLYNRVGATMANSGNPEEALLYYNRALELNPTYIRARFNMGISCINLQRYQEAATHILDALVLQEADHAPESSSPSDPSSSTGGIKSSALWDTLRTTSLHMHRHDLAALCDPSQRDLARYRYELQNSYEP